MKNIEDLSSADSVLFDLDGTLWDASATATKAWNMALIELGYVDNIITQRELRGFTGIKIEDILISNFSFMSDDDKEMFLEKFERIEDQEMKRSGGLLYNDVEFVLKELKNSKSLFIVSNCLQGYIEIFLKITNLEKYFDGYESSGNTWKPKDSNIKKIIGDYKLRQPIFVGDTENDHKACILNDIPFIYASYGFGKAIKPEYRIEKFNDLLKIKDLRSVLM